MKMLGGGGDVLGGDVVTAMSSSALDWSECISILTPTSSGNVRCEQV